MIRAASTEPFDPGALLTAFSAGRDGDRRGRQLHRAGRAARPARPRRLELEAYPGFTEARDRRASPRPPSTASACTTSLIVHRIGRIAPGEPIVFVATAAAHRRDAFEACDYLMDYLKSPRAVLEEGTRPGRRPLGRADARGTCATSSGGATAEPDDHGASR